MTKTKKILLSIFITLFSAGLIFGIVWTCKNFNSIEQAFNGTQLYTQSDVDNAYADGKKDGLDEKNNNYKLIDEYKSQVAILQASINNYENEINRLAISNSDYVNQLENLVNQKTNLEEQVANLTSIKESNDNTIANLNAQILNFDSQILDMTLQIKNNSINTTALENKIAELEKSIEYYEQYINNLENDEQITCTFEFAGSVYNIQIISRNDKVSIEDPISTDYVIFNYWTIDGERVNLDTYEFTSSTRIIADVTYKYNVQFKVDDEVYNNQIVIKDGYATVPSNPTKDGYEFDGWTINGVYIVSDISTTSITQNITYIAKFTKLHTVKFILEDNVYSTQIIRNDECCSDVAVNSTTYKVFNGWKLNNEIVNLNTQKIYTDTIFIADITYKFDVKFIVDGNEYDSQIVVKDECPIIPSVPNKVGYVFDGWSIDGINLIENLDEQQITENVVYIALFRSIEFTTLTKTSELRSLKGDYVWYDGDNVYYSGGSNFHFKFDKEIGDWVSITWNGYQNFTGDTVWTDGIDIYFCMDRYENYKLDRETSTWVECSFNGEYNLSIPRRIWTCGEDVYYSCLSEHYKFDRTTETWLRWTFNGLSEFDGAYVCNLGGNNYYCADGVSYIFDGETNTWHEIVVIGDGSFGHLCWEANGHIYYSCADKQYELDINTYTWIEKIWIGSPDDFYGDCIWTDGVNYYYSCNGVIYIFS